MSVPIKPGITAILPTLMLALALILGACASEQPTAGRPVDPILDVECPGEPVPTDLVVTCHRVDVEGASLAVSVLHAPEPAGAPVLFLHGGPGGRAVAERHRWLTPRSELLDLHDVVLVDQRGGGHSTPSLDCPEMDHTGLTGGTFDGLDGDRACRDRLVSAASTPSTVTVARIAADLVVVRQALGIDRWHLHGVSFGTRIGLELLRTDETAIISAALDSVVPPDADETTDLPDGIVTALGVLETQCIDDGPCPAGVLEPLRRVLDRLAVNPIVVQVDERSLTVDDTAFLAAAVRTLGRPDGPILLPDAIALADTGRLAEAVDRLSPVGNQQVEVTRSTGDALSEGAWAAVTCGDQLPGMTFEPTDIDDSIHRAEHGRWSQLRARCAAWKIPSSEPVTRTPVRSAVPTLILAGGLDPLTPVRWAEAAARHLEDVEMVVSARWTHAPSTWNPCAAHLIARFFDSGERPSGGSTDC